MKTKLIPILCLLIAGCGAAEYHDDDSNDGRSKIQDDRQPEDDRQPVDPEDDRQPVDPEPGEPDSGPDGPAQHPGVEPCAPIAAQSAYCLAVDLHDANGLGNELHWVGLDDGEMCSAGELDLEERVVMGQSLLVEDGVAWMCADDAGDGSPFLIRHDLRSGRTEVQSGSCGNLIRHPAGGLLASAHHTDAPDFGEHLFRYEDVATFRAGVSSSEFSIRSLPFTIAATGDTLFTAWHATDTIEAYDVHTGSYLEEIRLDRDDDWIFGMAALDGRVVLTGATWGDSISVFDTTTGALELTTQHHEDLAGIQCFTR